VGQKFKKNFESIDLFGINDLARITHCNVFVAAANECGESFGCVGCSAGPSYAVWAGNDGATITHCQELTDRRQSIQVF
jgi:hypothetical protein